MNFIFISPNFPTNYWQFCKELKNNGANVLGIGDSPYDELDINVKENLNEYYRVDSLENYDEVYRAVAFFSFKYGKIDWLESNNEYWLEKDAMLRTDFNITTGFKNEDMYRIKFKSGMKKYYEAAGFPQPGTIWLKILKLPGSLSSLSVIPVIVKPDNGVGASATYKLNNEAELVKFF